MVASLVALALATIHYHHHDHVIDLRSYTAWSWALLGLLVVGWPIWRLLAPRPIRALRALAVGATCTAVWVAYACAMDPDLFSLQVLALRAYTVVAIALHAEIARALLDRRRHRSELVPEMRARRRRCGASIDAPISISPP